MSERTARATDQLPGPADVRQRALANGLQVLARENHESPSVVIHGMLRCGSLYDPARREGLAAFTAAMLERGTQRRSFATLSADLESISAEVEFGAHWHTMSFHARCLAEDLPQVLATAQEMLVEPAFGADEMERLRGQILTGLQEKLDDTGYRGWRAFRQAAYGANHPYARPPDGTIDSVTALRRSDLVSYYERFVRPEGGIVVVVGNVDAGAGIELVERTLGQWLPSGQRPADPDVPVPPRPAASVRVDVPMPGKVQSDIFIGNPAIARRHPDFVAASLANTVLGVFGLMGRLGTNVRDRLGLAYHVRSHLHGGLGPGPWSAVAAVNPARSEEAIQAILDEIRRLRDEPVPDAELADVRAYATGSLPLKLETNAGVASALLDIALHDLGLDYLQRYGQIVEALEPEDLQRAARAHLHPDTAAITVAGPPRP